MSRDPANAGELFDVDCGQLDLRLGVSSSSKSSAIRSRAPIAMGHDGMLYSLPSRELIATASIYGQRTLCRRHVCISNCDKITPGMLMAALASMFRHLCFWRSNGGGKVVLKGKEVAVDLVDAMVIARRFFQQRGGSDHRASGLPNLRSCSGMFTPIR